MFEISFYRNRKYYSVFVDTLELAYDCAFEIRQFGYFPYITKGGKIIHNTYEAI